jgi:hypothetical protein
MSDNTCDDLLPLPIGPTEWPLGDYFQGHKADQPHPLMVSTGTEGRCELCGGLHEWDVLAVRAYARACVDAAVKERDAEIALLKECLGRADRHLADETAIVDRIWYQLGRPTYEQLAGRTIYDLIDELKQRAERLRAALEEKVETLDNLVSAMTIPMPDRLHVMALKEALPRMLRELRAALASDEEPSK